MSKIALSGNASGTGTFTIASPNSNSDRTLNLPDAAGTIQVSGNPISGTTGTFTGLVDISAAGAGQIQFPATQNASANANTLDDYEEGTWTPALAFGGGSTGMTFSSLRQGYYVKIGRTVTCTFQVQLSNKGSSTGVATLTGLPFTNGSPAGNYGTLTVGYFQSMNNLPNNAFNHTVDDGSSAVQLRFATSGTSGDLTDANFTNSSRFLGTITYFV
jgi:hypothetical protein